MLIYSRSKRYVLNNKNLLKPNQFRSRWQRRSRLQPQRPPPGQSPGKQRRRWRLSSAGRDIPSPLSPLLPSPLSPLPSPLCYHLRSPLSIPSPLSPLLPSPLSPLPSSSTLNPLSPLPSLLSALPLRSPLSPLLATSTYYWMSTSLNRMSTIQSQTICTCLSDIIYNSTLNTHYRTYERGRIINSQHCRLKRKVNCYSTPGTSNYSPLARAFQMWL